METSSPFTLVLAALPALALVIKTLWPGDGQGLGNRLKRTMDVVERLPEEEGKSSLAFAAQQMARQIAWSEDRRLRRRVDGAILGTILVVTIAAGAMAGFLWQVDHIVARVGSILIAGFAVLLVVVGGLPTVRPVHETYRFEEEPKPPKPSRK